MEKTKKLLQKEMGDNKILIEENEILRKQHREASAINEILALSQRKYEEKWKKLYHALQFYKDFYHKYLELILSNVSNKTSEFQDIDKYREQHSNFEVLLRDPEKVIREKSKKDDEAGKLVNISILEYNDENIKEDHKLDQICQMTEREDFRNYLLNLAKDVNLLFNITKKNSQNNKAICPAVKFKRSMSNPIDYRTEIKKLWLENVNNKPINLINANEILIKNEKALIKNSNRNIGMPLKSPAFGINYSENKENDELGLESPEQMIYHTNYEEEEIV